MNHRDNPFVIYDRQDDPFGSRDYVDIESLRLTMIL